MENGKEEVIQPIDNQNGSQNYSVSRFGNSSSDQIEKNSIKDRIDTSRSRNLIQNNIDANETAFSGLGNNEGLKDKPGLESSVNNLKSGKKSVDNLEDTIKDSTSTKRRRGLGLGRMATNTLLNTVANSNETAGDVVRTAYTTTNVVRILQMIVKFFMTPLGWGALVFLFVFSLIVIVIVFLSTIVSSLGMKFGFTGSETLDSFNDTYKEGLSVEEINDMAKCDIPFFNRVKSLFFGPDLSDNCELSHYIKNILDDKSASTGINNIAPGYLVSTLYYAFDTQNRDDNGDLYINPSDYVDSEMDYATINDLDAVSTLVKVGRYEANDFKNLLNYYVLNEDYTYYTYDDCTTTDGVTTCKCKANPYEDNSISVQKFLINLRYGETVSNVYQSDLNDLNAYNKTDSECKGELGFSKPDITKYDIKADPSTLDDDGAKININGTTYGYNNGFIFTTFPRYDTNYGFKSGSYDYMVDKDIEVIIENIESRQDYTNYILGYPSDVKTELSYNSGSSGGTCTYSIGGIDMSDIKVRLLYGKYDPEGKQYQPIEGQELINFEDYITGVVYGEISGVEEESSKAQAIAVRTYAFLYGQSYHRLEQENGQWILSIVNSDEAQVYCDPNKGCYKKCNGGYNAAFSEGTVPEGVTCEIFLPAISEDSVIRKAVRETAGMILLNSNGEPEIINNRGVLGYRDIDQRKWIEMAKNGSVYEEILKYAYPNGNLKTNTCSILANGWVLPLKEIKSISSCYGYRYIFGKYSYHSGIDIPGALNEPIYSIADGKITSIVPLGGSYGNYVMVDHGNGYVSRYAHMNKFVTSLKVGDTVNAGQQIGFVGSTGRSTGNHLHLEIIYNGKTVEPMEVLDPSRNLNIPGDCR